LKSPKSKKNTSERRLTRIASENGGGKGKLPEELGIGAKVSFRGAEFMKGRPSASGNRTRGGRKDETAIPQKRKKTT